MKWEKNTAHGFRTPFAPSWHWSHCPGADRDSDPPVAAVGSGRDL